MAELRLAGNFIDFTSVFGGYGHLQIVFVDDNDTQFEVVAVQTFNPNSSIYDV